MMADRYSEGSDFCQRNLMRLIMAIREHRSDPDGGLPMRFFIVSPIPLGVANLLRVS